MRSKFYIIINDSHLIEKVLCTRKLVDDKEAVSYIEADVAAVVGVEQEVAHGAFPAAVEVDAYQLAVGIQHRTAAVAAGGVIGGDESHCHFAAHVSITPVVLCALQLF